MNQHIDPIIPPFRKNKNFVYKGKKYPIDFGLVKKYSNYFYNNKDKFKSINDIQISLDDDNYEINEDSISMFVKCVQNQPFDINESNIFSLQKLSNRYGVQVLIDLTDEYIKKNYQKLIFHSIKDKYKENYDLSSDEDFISKNLFDYINDEELVSLPVPFLYKVINNKNLNFDSLNSSQQSQVVEFLFKCLTKHKRDASILFLNLDLENERVEIIPRLISGYSDVFDFNFINPKFLAKKTSSIMSEIQKLKLDFSNKLAEIEKLKDTIMNSNHSLENKVAELEKKIHEMELNVNSKADSKEANTSCENLEKRITIIETNLEKLSKIRKIIINSNPNSLIINSTITLSTSVKPLSALNDDVEWEIVPEKEKTVEIIG